MSLLIKGMDMPEHMKMRDYTLRVRQDGTAELIDRSIGESYDVIDVPTPHGDLIDRDHLLDILDEIILKPDSYAQRCMAMATKRILIHQTPVIKAEGKS